MIEEVPVTLIYPMAQFPPAYGVRLVAVSHRSLRYIASCDSPVDILTSSYLSTQSNTHLDNDYGNLLDYLLSRRCHRVPDNRYQ